MEQTAKIKELIEPTLTDNEVKLYDVKWTSENKNRILQISITKNDGTMDLDTCALVSEKVSELLDDVIDSQYMLEVCSPGAEREIKDYNELKDLIGQRIYVRLKHSIKSNIEFTGDIESVSDVVLLKYRDKAALRSVEFSIEEIEFARLAVKI